MMSTGKSRAAGLAILARPGGARPRRRAARAVGRPRSRSRRPISAATAGHLAKLSDRVASDLDAGDTCHAAHAADDLRAAVEEADLPASRAPGRRRGRRAIWSTRSTARRRRRRRRQPRRSREAEGRAPRRRASRRPAPRRRTRDNGPKPRPRRQGPARPGQAEGGARMNQHLGAERYELEHRLGHGGMATVYLARDLKLDREVAIKLLADNFAGDDEVRKRFSREARLAARAGPSRTWSRCSTSARRTTGPTSSWSTSTAARSRDRLNGRKSVDRRGRGTAPARPALRRARPRPCEEARPPRHQAPEPAPARRRTAA